MSIQQGHTCGFCDDVVIETVKPCEDAEKAYILRLYEAAGGYSRAKLTCSYRCAIDDRTGVCPMLYLLPVPMDAPCLSSEKEACT